MVEALHLQDLPVHACNELSLSAFWVALKENRARCKRHMQSKRASRMRVVIIKPRASRIGFYKYRSVSILLPGKLPPFRFRHVRVLDYDRCVAALVSTAEAKETMDIHEVVFKVRNLRTRSMDGGPSVT
ncbi:hypothetical protein bAD24_p00590 (plasmid) [Burkholderia sp. AD24]|nr:hypothetical protein bAD24_p00590 [Burkholderia sp. AD24]